MSLEKNLLNQLLQQFASLDDKPAVASPKDEPDFKLFTLQVINRFSGVIGDDPLSWSPKPLRNKKTGKIYRVTVTLEEVPPGD